MSIIKLNKIKKTFGTDHILRGLNAVFHPGEKVGLLGANGSGKTTLFKIILKQVRPDAGQAIIQKHLRIGYLPQEPVFDPTFSVQEVMHEGLEDLLNMEQKLEDLSELLSETAGDELEEAMKQYDRLNHAFEMAGGYTLETRIKTILAGVGLGEEVYHSPISTLSGGQLSRLGLARALTTEVDLLLLDEPTNHLDLRAVAWLEGFLKSYKGAVILISHDRYLLNTVVGKIAEISSGKCRIWKGNYKEFLANKEIERTQQQRDYEKTTAHVAKTQDFIERNRNLKGMQGTARGRAKQLEKLIVEKADILEKPSHEKKLSFHFAEVKSKSDLVLRCEKLEKSFGGLCLFKDIGFDLLRGERLGITGPNGTGKSTFLKLALEKIEPTAGIIRLGQNLKIGYLDQQGNELDPNNTLLEEVATVDASISTERLRSVLGGFLFSGEDAFKKTSNLSGGEQNRLMLCKLVLAEPDVLILDEPTNHLDIGSKEALEKALNAYQGAVITVSHDRYFLDSVAQKLLVLGVNHLGKLDIGNYEFILGGERDGGSFSKYANTIAQRRQQHENELKKRPNTAKKPKRGSNAEKRRTPAPADLKRFNKLSVEEIEEQIMEFEEDAMNLEEKFGDENVYKDPIKFEQLKADIAAAKEELELLYRAYERRE
jgi:ATP-binding cassette subfamily F protein 3